MIHQQEEVTIILAEDDEGHATLVERNLARAGVRSPIVRFANGAEALLFIQTESTGHPAKRFLMIADLNMPVLDGLGLLRRVRAHPATKRMPVIILTTTDDPREIASCYDLGCNVYIVKPVAYDSFVESIARLGHFLQVISLPGEPSH